MTSINIVFRKDKLNKNGEAPIHFRIIKDRKISYITSGFMVHQNDWDEANKRIKGKSKDKANTTARINAAISKRFLEIQNEVIDLDASRKRVTTKALREAVVGKSPQDFFAFADTVVESYLHDKKIGTHARTKSVIKKLKAYSKDLSFDDITPKFLTEYEKYLKTKEGNSINTIHANFKFIRCVFNAAYRQDLISFDNNPFHRYQMKTEKTQSIYLTEKELKDFEEVETDKGTRMELHKDMFVFASNTGGLRVSDMLQLQWKHFTGEHIDFTIKKTGMQLSIKVPNKGLAILNKYKPENPNPNSFIFDMLPEGVLELGPAEIDNAISSATAYINKNLKLLAAKAKLEKKISFHVSRHTWATRALRIGITIDKVSKLMGHATIKETQGYAKIIDAESDKAMDKFNF
jgi:integrase/recombinase XerD